METQPDTTHKVIILCVVSSQKMPQVGRSDETSRINIWRKEEGLRTSLVSGSPLSWLQNRNNPIRAIIKIENSLKTALKFLTLVKECYKDVLRGYLS